VNQEENPLGNHSLRTHLASGFSAFLGSLPVWTAIFQTSGGWLGHSHLFCLFNSRLTPVARQEEPRLELLTVSHVFPAGRDNVATGYSVCDSSVEKVDGMSWIDPVIDDLQERPGCGYHQDESPALPAGCRSRPDRIDAEDEDPSLGRSHGGHEEHLQGDAGHKVLGIGTSISE
jgi:hypothetical protein